MTTSLSDGAKSAKPKHLRLGPLSYNGDGGPARPYVLCDTSNGKAPHRCAVTFGTETGGQGYPYIGKESQGSHFTLRDAEEYAKLFAAAPSLYTALSEPMGKGESPNFATFADELDAIAGSLALHLPHHCKTIAFLRERAQKIRAALSLATPTESEA